MTIPPLPFPPQFVGRNQNLPGAEFGGDLWPDHDVNCRTARAAVPSYSLAGWTTDQCANVVFGEFILRGEHAVLFDTGSIPGHLRVGYAYPLSVHLTRVMYYETPAPVIIPPEVDTTTPTSVHESCRFHIGHDVIYDGKERVMFAGKRGYGDNTVHASILRTSFIWKNSITPLDGSLSMLRRGYEYELGAYATPVAIEVHVGAPMYICGMPI